MTTASYSDEDATRAHMTAWADGREDHPGEATAASYAGEPPSDFCHCTNGFGHTRGIDGCVHAETGDSLWRDGPIDPDPVRPWNDTVDDEGYPE